MTPEPVSAEGSCRLHRQLAAAPGSESPPTTLSNVVQGGRDPSAAADASSATKRKSLPSSTALLVMTRKGTVSALPREPNSTHSLLSVHTRSQLEVRALSRLAANAELTPPRQAVGLRPVADLRHLTPAGRGWSLAGPPTRASNRGPLPAAVEAKTRMPYEQSRLGCLASRRKRSSCEGRTSDAARRLRSRTARKRTRGASVPCAPSDGATAHL